MPSEPSLLTKLLSGAAQATGDARDRIISTAVEQISDFGVRRFTVDELARRVGLSRVTIYRHFPSKDEVLEAAVLHEMRVLMTEVDAAVAPFETVEERVVEGFVFTVSHLRRHAAFQRLLRTEPELILPLLTTNGGQLLAAGREFIAAFARKGTPEVSASELEILCELLARLITSVVLTPESAAAMGSDDDLRAFAERYVGGIARTFIHEPVPSRRG